MELLLFALILGIMGDCKAQYLYNLNLWEQVYDIMQPQNIFLKLEL